MSRFRHRAKLAALPRPLVDEVAGALLTALEEVPVTGGPLETGADIVGDVRLVEGEHLSAGALYRLVPPDMEDEYPDIEARVVSWDRAGECRVDVRSDIEGHVVNARVELRMAGDRLHTVRIEGDYQGPGRWFLRVLQRAEWKGEALFEEWWSVLGRRTSPISLSVRHPLAFGSIVIDRGKDKRTRWTGESTLRFGGRGIARPLAAVGLLIMRGRVRRMLRDAFGRAEAAWNAEVPGMVERGLRERVTLRHQVEVEAVTREWAEKYVASLHQGVEGLRFKKRRLSGEAVDIRLLEGKHIEVGARYRVAYAEDEVEPLDVNVAAWDVAGLSRIEFASPDEVQAGWAELDSAQKPIVVRGAVAGEFDHYEQLSCAGEGNLERWWASTGGSGGEDPAFTAIAEHPLGEGTLAISVSPAKGGRWTVDLTATVEGRAWARPLVAVAGLISAAVLNDPFQWTADHAAEDWNRVIPAATASDPQDAAEATLRRLLDGPADDAGTD
ncbi:hypothetical protein ACTWPP_12055 [Actinomadura sp. 3N407]